MAAANNSVHETFLTGRCVGGIEEVLSQGQQDTITTIHSVDSALLSPPQTSDDGPEPFQSHVEDIVHGLTKLFPYPFLCLGDRHSNSPLRLPVPICGSQDSRRLKRPDTTLLQFYNISPRRCPSIATPARRLSQLTVSE